MITKDENENKTDLVSERVSFRIKELISHLSVAFMKKMMNY
jgi:hypothetical protein